MKNTEISERISHMIESQEVTINDFAKKIGYSRAQAVYDMVNGKSAPSFSFFSKLLCSEYSETFNIEWIITGQGTMLKKGYTIEKERKRFVTEEPMAYNHTHDKDLRTTIKTLQELVQTQKEYIELLKKTTKNLKK